MTDIGTYLRRETERQFPSLVELQRDLHSHPELGYEERRTAGRVAREMEALGLSLHTGVVKTGVVATMEGGQVGDAVALRVDMDAFRSTNPGVAHVCGHDAHTTIGIGVARVLAGLRQHLKGSVRFIFQPAEERPLVEEEGEKPYLEGVRAVPAARMMVQEGVLEDPQVAAVYGLHLWPWLEAGQVGIEDGPAMAGAANFLASVFGKSAHGATPHAGVDSIVAVAQVLSLLQTIVSRQTSPGEPLVITVGTVRGGDRRNVIADRVDISGTVRCLSTSLLEKVVPEKMRAVLEGVTIALGASYELDYYPLILPVMNDGRLAALARRAVAEVLGQAAVVASMDRAMTSEDFACYAEAVPGLYMKVGCSTPGTEVIPLHNRAFSFDEEAIRVGVIATSAAICGRLSAT